MNSSLPHNSAATELAGDASPAKTSPNRSHAVRVRAFIFDMDGVIIDSNPVHRKAWEEFNRRNGLATTEDMQRRMYGKRNDEIVRDFYGALLSEIEVFEYGAAKERVYREMIGVRMEAYLVPGVREFLNRYAVIPAAVASNAEPANLHFVLDGSGLADRFRFVVDGFQVARPKPFPDIYLKAADLLGVSPDECLVFEDSYAGVTAARDAGIRVIGITTTHPELPGAEFTVASFLDPQLSIWMDEVAGSNRA